jgi:hypothetical protein
VTGYLQRMAETALQPGRAIRPMLGSIFAPAGRAAASQSPPLEEDTLSSAVDRPAPPPPRVSLDVQASSPPLRSAPSDNRAVTRYEPLVAPTAESIGEIEPPVTAQRAPSTPLPTPPSAAQETDTSGARLMQSADGTAPSPRQAQNPADNVETLLPAQPAGAIARLPDPPQPAGAVARLPRPPDIRAEPSPAAAFSAAKPRGAIRDSHPAAPDNDDIQIHIGRIEVTAVRPTPAPQPAAKTRRGAPSLDEYIRRRDGRAS